MANNFAAKRKLEGHKGGVLVVRFNFDGMYCVSGGLDRTIRLWNPIKGSEIKVFGNVHGYEVKDVQLTMDNSKFASCGGDRDVFLWDVTKGECLRRFRGHSQKVNSIGWNKECSVLASGSMDTSVRLWDVRSSSREPIQVLHSFRDSVSCVKVTDGQIIGASFDGTVRTFDLRKSSQCIDHIGVPISSLSVSNDGNCLLMSCLDASLKLFDCSNGKLLNEYKGHQHKSYQVNSCFSNNDAIVLSGSEDGRIFLWDLVDPSKFASIDAHGHIVTCIDYHPLEDHIVSSSMDGSVIVWS